MQFDACVCVCECMNKSQSAIDACNCELVCMNKAYDHVVISARRCGYVCMYVYEEGIC